MSPLMFSSRALSFLNTQFILFAAIGFTAQLIDGALGMAYGISSNTMLLSSGVPPAYASACVHIAEIFTTGASGLSHWKLKNINKKLFKSLVIPGVIGVVIGAFILSNIDGKVIRPYIAAYLLIMGILIIRRGIIKPKKKKTKNIFPLAVSGGFMDAVGGGGWGPIVVSTLINKGRAPLYTIGSVNLAEFFIALAGSISFILSLYEFHYFSITMGLIAGGVVAAPIGAYICRLVKPRPLMIIVGALVVALSLRTILLAF